MEWRIRLGDFAPAGVRSADWYVYPLVQVLIHSSIFDPKQKYRATAGTASPDLPVENQYSALDIFKSVRFC